MLKPQKNAQLKLPDVVHCSVQYILYIHTVYIFSLLIKGGVSRHCQIKYGARFTFVQRFSKRTARGRDGWVVEKYLSHLKRLR